MADKAGSPEFRKVLEGIRKGAGKPDGKATAKEIAEAKRLMERDKKRAHMRHDDGVIDTGMFSS